MKGTITVSTPKKKQKKPATKKAAPKKVTTPRQEPMFDSAINSLEKLAEDYAEARDNRQEYLNQEVQIKGELLDEMHKLGKTDYVRGNIEIHIVSEEETVKVKIKKDKAEAAAASV